MESFGQEYMNETHSWYLPLPKCPSLQRSSRWASDCLKVILSAVPKQTAVPPLGDIQSEWQEAVFTPRPKGVG